MKDRLGTPRRGKGHVAPEGVPEGIEAPTSGEWKLIGGDAPERDGFLKSILHSLDTGVIVADQNGSFVFFNKTAERIIGLGPLDVPQAEWSATYGCYLPDKVTPYPAEQLPLARSMRGEHVRDAEVFIRNDRNPSGAWISVSATPLYRTTGELRGGVVSFQDITARKESFEVVRRLRHAVERTTDGVFITDARGSIEFVNPAFERITGYSRKEALGQTPRILKSGVHGRDYYERLWATVLAGNVHSSKVINRKKSGELFHAEQTITPVLNRDGSLTHFVSVVRDVTQLRRAEENEVKLRLARMVQQKLYPSGSLRLPGIDLAGVAHPADATGGDYYDFIPMLDGCVGIAIGDVSGHGFAPALLMAETRAYLRSLVRTMTDPGRILRQVNEFLCADTEPQRFVTLTLIRLDPRQLTLAHASAGHVPGYVLDDTGAIKSLLGATGMPLGFFPSSIYETGPEIALARGDVTLLLTDGITEARGLDNELFGEQRTLEVVRAQRHGEARQIVDGLHAAVRDFSGQRPQPDDITAVACKIV